MKDALWECNMRKDWLLIINSIKLIEQFESLSEASDSFIEFDESKLIFLRFLFLFLTVASLF